MRVLISTYGTRGDVQPYVALAKALKARGHTVVVCTPSGFRAMVDRHGVDYAHMDNAVLELTEAVLRAPTRRQQRQLFKGFGSIIRALLEDEWRAAQALRPDVVVYHSKALGGHHIAEKLGIAEVLAMPLPLTPTRAFPVPLLPDLRLGDWFNRFSYRLVSLGTAFWAGATNDFRVRTLGLRPLPRFADAMRRTDGSMVTALYAFSEQLLPRPADWPENAHVQAAPHDWLFPRMSAVVHHGGAGTTMAGLRAGRATVICPFLGDQPFWGGVVHRAGAGPKPVRQKQLSAERLAKRIREALAPTTTATAEKLGARISAEDGAARAVALIEEELGRSRTRALA